VLLALVGVIKDARNSQKDGDISNAVKAFETELRNFIRDNRAE